MMAHKNQDTFKNRFFVGTDNCKLISHTDFSCNMCYRYVRSLLAKSTACLKLIYSFK